MTSHGEAWSLRWALNELGIPWEAVTSDGRSAGTQTSNTSVLMAFCADHTDATDTRVAGVIVGSVAAAKTAMGLQGLIAKAAEPSPKTKSGGRSGGPSNNPYDPQARQKAIEFLVHYLGGGARNAKDALKAGEAKGIKPHTLRRSAKSIGVIVEPVRRDGKVSGWTWKLGEIKWAPQPKEKPDNTPHKPGRTTE
jgi:hypothetical protein